MNETNKRLFDVLTQILDLPEKITYLSLTLSMDKYPELIINRLVDNVTIEEGFAIRLPKFERMKIGLEEGIEHAKNLHNSAGKTHELNGVTIIENEGK